MNSLQEVADAWAAPLLGLLREPETTTTSFTSTSTGAHLGSLVCSTGDVGGRTVMVVDTRLVIPDLGIDSVMLHAFSPGDTSAPHLLSDLAELTSDGRTEWHFHVDLMPRVDVVEELDYLTAVYVPLTAAYDAAYAIDGMRPIAVPPRLRSLTSGYLVGVVVRPDQFADIDPVFDAYAQRWQDLLIAPPLVTSTAGELASRDQVHRAAMFDPRTDIVWDFLADIIGRAEVDAILEAIRS